MLGPASPRRPVFARPTPPRRVQQRALPYYQKHDTRRWRLLVWILSIVALGGLAWLLLASPVLAIHSLEIHGLQRTDQAQVESAIDGQLDSRWLLLFSRRATLLAPTGAIVSALEQLPTVKSAHVSRRLPGSLVVDVQERVASVQWESGGQWYEVDLDGKVIRPLEAAPKAPSGPSLPRIVASSKANIAVGDTVASQKLIQLAIDSASGPQDRGSDYASPGASPDELYVHAGGFRILLTTNKPLDEQYRSAQGVLASIPKDELPKLDLIDARLPELPTYKLR